MTKQRFLGLSALAAFCCCTLTLPAQADSLAFDNLSAPTSGTDSVASVGPLADSFSTSEYGTTLNQVSVKLLGDDLTDAGSVTVQLLSDASGNPGNSLATIGTISDTSLRSTLADYNVALSTPYNLAANTRYWVQLTSNNSSAEWAWSFDQSGNGVANESFANSLGTFANATNAPYQMAATTATPEPASLAFVGLGLVSVGALIRRKTKQV